MNYNFHDNYIHSIEIQDEDFNSNLVLDIDYIKEWLCEGDECQFIISPAHLIFREMSNLDIKISKPGNRINSYLETILDIHVSATDKNKYKYYIELLGNNFINFEAESLELLIYGKDHISQQQYLTVNERSVA